MADLHTIVPYALSDYEEAAYLLSKYFIQRGYNADIARCKSPTGGYSATIYRHGFLKNLLGSRTMIEVKFYPIMQQAQQDNALNDVKQPQAAEEFQSADGQAKARKGGGFFKKKRAYTDAKNAERETLTAKKTQKAAQELVYSTGISISSAVAADGAVKEILTYVTVLPAIRKLGDYLTMLKHAKRRSLIICEKLKVPE